MNYLQFTKFRNHARECFDSVEGGASFVIIRKGRPVARLLPFEEKSPGWKRDPERISMEGGNSTGKILREERDSG